MANKALTIPLTEELEPFKDDLEFFVQLMVRKLHVNRHKGFAENCDLADLIKGLMKELKEVTDALGEGKQFETIVEAADVSNFAFLLAARCLQVTRADFNRERGHALTAVSKGD